MDAYKTIHFYDTITKAFGKSNKVKMTSTLVEDKIAKAIVIDKEGNEWEIRMEVK